MKEHPLVELEVLKKRKLMTSKVIFAVPHETA